MRRHHGRVGFLGLVVASLWLMGGVAKADVTTERSASILVFPKVIVDGTRDTIIQISNTSNTVVRAHCFYVNGALTNPNEPAGPFNPPLWQEVDFDILLTKQQPTHWLVSRGRNVNPFDAPCGPGDGVCIGGSNAGRTCSANAQCPDSQCSNHGCTDAGFDPGLIPPVIPGFTGELKCVEVDDSGAPLAGNHMKGEATLVTLANGDVSKYNGIGIIGNENNGDGQLILGGGQCVGDGALHGVVCTSDDQCAESAPCAMEYNACPSTWIVNHPAEGAPNLAVANFDSVSSATFTELTIVPCTQNFETQEPTSVTIQFLSVDEFESTFSVSTTVTCWGSFFLTDLNAPALIAGATGASTGIDHLEVERSWFMNSRLRVASATQSEFLTVVETFNLRNVVWLDHPSLAHFLTDANEVAASAGDVHHEGEGKTSIITIPAEQLAP